MNGSVGGRGRQGLLALGLGVTVAATVALITPGGAGGAAPSGSRVTSARLTTVRQLSAALALRAVRVALTECTREGFRVSVAVVDPSGLERATVRGNGAGAHTHQTAVRKAFTAASFRTPTSELAERVQDPAASTLRDIPGVLMLGGGLPIQVEGELVGGIGVSGAPGGDLDEACAQAGIDAVLEKLNGG
jgi:uncharacterized protein GlcG (DUF336 family)